MTTTSVSSTIIWHGHGDLGDTYDAPEGMPDFDQRQDASWNWSGHICYCGPTSAANALWYLDCRHDTNGQNSHSLINHVHNPSIVHAFIEDLAEKTDSEDYDGARPEEMKTGLENYICIRGQTNNYTINLVEKPSLIQVANWVNSGDIVLLYGRYGLTPYRPSHTHWVTVQAVIANATNSGAIKISDPCHDGPDDYEDSNGKPLPSGNPIFSNHNNSGLVNHDKYDVNETRRLCQTYNGGFHLEHIWSNTSHKKLFAKTAVVIKKINHPTRTISITSCTPYDSDNNGNNDSVSVSYSAGTDIETEGVVRAKLINPPNSIVCNRTTEEFSLNPSSPTTGVLNLTLPSDQFSSVYEVRVEVMEADNSAVEDMDNTTVYLLPTTIHAHFWYDNEEGNKTVEFTDASYTSAGCTLTSWNWDFDDGTTSTAENPDHTYNYSGTYDVTLTVADDYGNNDTTTIPVTVTGTPPSGEFSLDSAEVQTYLQSMTLRSSVDDSDNPVPLSGPAYNFSYDMGDGTTYYTQNVTHTYSKGGTYKVTMTVTDLDNYTDIYTMEYFTPDILVQDGITDNRNLNHWSSLSDGLDTASGGDIIYIANGSYNGGLTLSSNLTLVGECRENVTINTSSTVFTVNSDNVRMGNMTLTGGTTGIAINNQSNITLSNLYVRNMTYGVSIINNSNNITVNWSSFENNTYGVYAADSSNLTVGGYTEEVNETFNNTIFVENTRAIYLDDMTDVGIFSIDVDASIPYTSLPPPTYGIDMDDTQRVIIHSAHIYDAHTSAINVDESDFVEIICGHFEDNPYGVYCTAAEDCLVGECLINDNDNYGVVFSDLLCFDNVVILNDFINNTAYDSSNKLGPTVWTFTDKINFTIGNYWNASGLLFEDTDGDGISDDALSLAGPPRSDPEDPLPVMERYDWLS